MKRNHILKSTSALGSKLLAIVGISAMLGMSSIAMAQVTKETKSTTESTVTKETTAPNGAASSNGAASTNGAAGSAKKGADKQTAPADIHAAMESSDQKMKSMKMTGDIDRDYAMMMRAHHQGAVDMSQSVLTHGKDPEMKRMARKIISNNKNEMSQFDKWLNKQKSTKKGSNGEASAE